MNLTDRRWLLPTTIALLALAACVTSIGHEFTYDDRYAVLMNPRVHTMDRIWRFFSQTYWPPRFGGDGYRPIVLALFSVQWALGDGAPWLFHLGNIVLAVGAALAVYWMALALLPPAWAWLAAALFAVHPVHVESTGNVVGQAELLVGLLVAASAGWFLRRRAIDDIRWRDVSLITLLYSIALFTKENAIVFPALVLAAEWTVVTDDRPWRVRLARLRPLVLVLIAATLAYAYARGRVQQDLVGFAPNATFRFLNMGAEARIGTMLHEFPRIAQLVLFPTRLSADYSPPDVIIANGIGLAEIPGLMLVLCTVLLALILRWRAPLASFGLLWFIIAYFPVSNLLITTGIITAERTLFLPSVGIVLLGAAAAAWAWTQLRRRGRTVLATAMGALLALGLWRSVDRQKVWRNNDVLFASMVKDAPNGYRGHIMRGRQFGTQKRLRDMEREFRRGISLFPYDAGVTVDVAEGYRRAGLCDPALPLYEWSFALDSTYPDGRLGYVYCLSTQERWAETRAEALKGLRYGFWWEGKYLRNAIAVADSALGRPHKVRPPL